MAPSEPKALSMIRNRHVGKSLLIPPAVVVAVFLVTGVVVAVHEAGAFELDGNAVDNTGGGVDWENIYDPQTDAGEGQSSFLVDGSAANGDDVFTGGGSKDVNDISQ